MSNDTRALRQPPRRLNFKKPDAPTPTTPKHRCGHALETGRSRKKQCSPCAAAARARDAENHSLKAIRDRLPHGSEFRVRYDGLVHEWRGELRVGAPGTPEQDPTFSAIFLERSGTVFALLTKLDRAYRKAMRADKKGKGEG